MSQEVNENFEKVIVVETSYYPVQSVNGKTGNVTLTAEELGLDKIENTSDLDKPISRATQAALDLKEPILPLGTASQYIRGDKTLQILNKQSVGLDSVDNTSDLEKPISIAAEKRISELESGTYSSINTAFFRLSSVDQEIDKLKSISEAVDIKFRSSLESGIESKYVNYPSGLVNKPRTVHCEMENDVDDVLYMYRVSNITNTGFMVSFSDRLSNTGYFLNIQLGL